MQTPDVDRKRVLVVGGSTGIGLAVARRLTGLGAHTTVLARRRAALERALADLEAVRRHPAQRLAFAELDVRDAGMVGRVLGGLVASDGAPDVLVNCAGRAYPRRFEEIDHAQLMDTLQTNLVGCWST